MTYPSIGAKGCSVRLTFAHLCKPSHGQRNLLLEAGSLGPFFDQGLAWTR
jgi:hypothetical protein